MKLTHDRQKWIQYSCRDSLVTWMVYRKLEENLKNMVWKVSVVFSIMSCQSGKNMMDFYQEHIIAFGELLTDMERKGIMVDKVEVSYWLNLSRMN